MYRARYHRVTPPTRPINVEHLPSETAAVLLLRDVTRIHPAPHVEVRWRPDGWQCPGDDAPPAPSRP